LIGGIIEVFPIPSAAMTTTYTTEIAANFCAAIADGGSLRSVCKKAGMPSKATVFRWLAEQPDFVKMYEKATDERADGQIDEIVDIADNCKPDKDSIRKAKLRIDARVEQAQRMKPRKYGRQLQLTGEGGGPVPVQASLDVAGLSTAALAEIMKAKDAAERR
jgi:hypothetical protein